jgi:hypothetical protein
VPLEALNPEDALRQEEKVTARYPVRQMLRGRSNSSLARRKCLLYRGKIPPACSRLSGRYPLLVSVKKYNVSPFGSRTQKPR